MRRCLTTHCLQVVTLCHIYAFDCFSDITLCNWKCPYYRHTYLIILTAEIPCHNEFHRLHCIITFPFSASNMFLFISLTIHFFYYYERGLIGCFIYYCYTINYCVYLHHILSSQFRNFSKCRHLGYFHFCFILLPFMKVFLCL